MTIHNRINKKTRKKNCVGNVCSIVSLIKNMFDDGIKKKVRKENDFEWCEILIRFAKNRNLKLLTSHCTPTYSMSAHFELTYLLSKHLYTHFI